MLILITILIVILFQLELLTSRITRIYIAYMRYMIYIVALIQCKSHDHVVLVERVAHELQVVATAITSTSGHRTQ